MLLLSDTWTWDLWLIDDGSNYHVFFLRASRALLDPDRRHRRAGIGHAVSADLRNWTVLPDALVHADPDAFDDLATWTGSVVADPAGGWRMFYTGISRAENGDIQRVGAAASSDLIEWHRDPGSVIEADRRWYEKHRSRTEIDETWRDPWVFADPSGRGWHMLVTGCVAADDHYDRGVVGHATSPDLRQWDVAEPLSEPGAGFGHLEVMQVDTVHGQPVMIFSCSGVDVSASRRAAFPRAGMWAMALDTMLGPFDFDRAYPLTGPELYGGRIIQDRAGEWVLLAFQDKDENGEFAGGIIDPVALHWTTSASGHPRLSLSRTHG